MYFVIGGRKVQSGLYRVSYKGSESTTPAVAPARSTPERDLRHQLEAFHGKKDPKAVAAAWPHLAHKDRFVRWAARTAIESQNTGLWQAKALAEKDPATAAEALLALSRAAGKCPQHREDASHVVDQGVRDTLLSSLLTLDSGALSETAKHSALRALEITLNRFGRPDDKTVASLIAKFGPLFPAATPELNWLLCETLVFLEDPTVAKKALQLIAEAPTQEEQMEYARSLRVLKSGWTSETRTAYLEWLLKAANYKGGASFEKFIEFIRTDAVATFTEAEKQTHAALLAKKPEKLSAVENLGAMFAGRTPTLWKLEDLDKVTATKLHGRSFDSGRKLFGATACYTCHRFGNEGGMTGPDLTGAGGRYTPHDLLDQILHPSKEINEQFVPSVLTKNDGTTVTGVVVNLNGDSVTLNTDLSDPNQRQSVDRKQVKSIEPSKVSPMPEMLLSMLKEDEIFDLVAYILSGGDKANAMFK
jgi:putative heme-binding domain-containing protein